MDFPILSNLRDGLDFLDSGAESLVEQHGQKALDGPLAVVRPAGIHVHHLDAHLAQRSQRPLRRLPHRFLYVVDHSAVKFRKIIKESNQLTNELES